MAPDNQDNQENGQRLAAQQVFGPQAAVYATSKVHIRDDSLESVERMVDAANGTNRYGWTLDLGTGAGFTAFAVAGVSDRVIASDVTEPMLRQAQRLGRERGISNLSLSHNAAEALPFADESEKGAAGVGTGQHRARANLFPAVQHHSGGTAAFHKHLCDRRLGPDLRTQRLRGTGDGHAQAPGSTL